MQSEARACCNLTKTPNNLQQTANNKTCRDELPIKPNFIDAHSMVHYTCDRNFLCYCEWLLGSLDPLGKNMSKK